MWMFTRYGFFSAVVDKTDNKVIVVRSREKAHLESLKKRFPEIKGLKITTSYDTDYAFRVRMSRDDWSWITQQLADELNWTNFKSEVLRFQGRSDYEHALHEVWSVMAQTQDTPPYSARR